MSQIQLTPPMQGLSDAQSFENQPAGTSTVLLNTSSIDPVTLKERFSQRAGSELYNDNALGNGKVQALVQSISDNQRTTFAATTTAAAGDLTVWSTVTPSKDSTTATEPDEFGNVFVIDGAAALVKYNSVGVEVWRFSLPMKDDDHICRAIVLDPFGNLYVGVSEGGNQASASLWAFSQDDDLFLKLRWQRQPGAFVERLRWRDGYLYAIENDEEGNRAYYSLWSGADTLTPVLAQRKDITAPVRDFVVNSAGAVVTTHPPSLTRRLDPRYPDYSYVLDDQRWHPTLLTQFKDRIWVHLSAEDLKSQIVGLKDGDPINIWRDKYGSGRKLKYDTAMSTAGTPKKFVAPTYVEKGPCGKPAVRFSGNRCRLISESNPNAEESMADLQRTIFPGYKNSGYVAVIVCKPSESAGEERILYQVNTPGTSRELWVNSTNGSAGGGASSGKVYSNQGSSAGTAPSAVQGQFDNRTSMAIISIVTGNGHNGPAPAGEPDYQFGFAGHTSFDSVWRVNGYPLTEFAANDFYTAAAGGVTIIGCQNDETNGFTGDITDIFILRDYTPTGGTRTLCTVPDYPAGTFDPVSDTEIERIEGYFAWNYGIPHMLDDGANAAWDLDGPHSNTFVHAFTSDIATNGPPNINGRDGDGTSASGSFDIDLLSPDPLTAKWSPQRGNVKWVNIGSGQGYGIAIDSEDNLYTVGPTVAPSTDTLRKWLDRGDSVTNPWNVSHTTSYGREHARLAVDKFDNIFVPAHWSGYPQSMVVHDSDGALLLEYKAAGSLLGYSVSIDPAIPDYGSQAITLPEFVYLTTRNSGIDANPTVHKIRLVARASTTGSVRNTAIIGVCEGDIKRFSAGVGAPVLISGGDNALRTDAVICGVWAYQKVWFLDGTNYKVYDPVTDTVTTWQCTSAGAMPAGARWMTLWNGRCWLIRTPGDPHNWHASAQGDFQNWDTNPAVVVATQAIDGNDAEMGMFPDIPNTLIPASRERMFVGCDHTIQLVYGDPLLGGSITEVSDETGANFGPSWCRDDTGVAYFFGSRGGVYRLTDTGCKAINDAITRRMIDLDLSASYVQLAWNSELDELWVLEVPYGAGGVERKLWRWQKRLDAWHEDSYYAAQLQPTCLMTYDADLVDDRAFLMGCEDGFTTNWSRTAKDDRGFPIDSQAVFGPYGIASRESRIGHPTIVLDTDQGGCNLEMFASETADKMNDPVHRTQLVPGRNETLFQTLRGSRIWFKLSSNVAGNRWSFERGTINVVDVGRERVRS